MSLHDKNGQENKRVLTLICLKMVHADPGIVKRLLACSAYFLSQSEQDTVRQLRGSQLGSHPAGQDPDTRLLGDI